MAARTTYPRPWTPPRFREPPASSSSGGAVGSGPAEAGTPILGSVIIFADPTGTITPGQRVTLTAVRTGTAPVTSYSWAKPPGSSAPSSSTNTLTWIAGANDSGTYTCTLTAAAPDSPASRGITLTVGGVTPPAAEIGLVTITGIIVPPEPPAFDPDAAAYIAAVEAADGQALEDGVRQAIDAFVIELKTTAGLWESLPVLAPFSGARTVEGAAVPLKAEAGPFEVENVTTGDYSRIFGLYFADLSGKIVFLTAAGHDFGSTLTGLGGLCTQSPFPFPPPWAHLLLYDHWPNERGLISAADIGGVTGNVFMMGINTNESGLMNEFVTSSLPANTYLAVSRLNASQHRSTVGDAVMVRTSDFVPQNPERPLRYSFTPVLGFSILGAFFSTGLTDAGNTALRAALVRFQIALATAIP